MNVRRFLSPEESGREEVAWKEEKTTMQQINN